MVPAFNEAATLEQVTRGFDAAGSRLGIPYEVVIVDDGSLDATGEIADRLAEELTCVRVIHHEVNVGLGGFYRTAFSEARYEYLTFLAADGQFPARIVEQYVRLMENTDMVLGYLSNPTPRSLPGRFLSWCEKVLYRILFGDIPKLQGALMFRRSLLDGMELKSTGRGWAILMEFLIRASRRGCRCLNAPIEILPRLHGHSKVNNIRTIWSNLKQVIGLRRYL